MEIQAPTPEQIERAQAAFRRFVSSLAARQGTDKPAIGVNVSQEFAAAFIESGAAEQQDIHVNDVFFGFAEGAASINVRLKIPGKAWPPRPPIDTRISLKISELAIAQDSSGGAVLFTVDEPLSFSSMFADLLLAMVGKFASSLPVSISELRTKGARVRLDFTALVRALRPELAQSAALVRLQKISLTPGHAFIELGFSSWAV